MPATSARPMPSPRSSAFSDFSHPHTHTHSNSHTNSRSDPVVVMPALSRDRRDLLHRDHYRNNHCKDQHHRQSSPVVLDHDNMTSTSASTSSSASHNLLPGTPNREKQQEPKQTSPHVRTNFERGYRPPTTTKGNPLRQPPSIQRQHNHYNNHYDNNNDANKPSTRTSTSSDPFDEMAFDVKNHMATPPRQPPTTWAAREERGRFVVTPPKYSDPTPLDTLHHPTATYGVRRDKAVALGMAAASTSPLASTSPSPSTGRVEDYYSSPHRILIPIPDPADYEDFRLSPGTVSAGTASINKGEISNPEEDDSLFDFEQEEYPPGLPEIRSNRKSSFVEHRRRRAQQQQQQQQHNVVGLVEEHDDRDDDTVSLEEEAPYGHKTPSPTNLHERAAQAWAVRREKVSSLRSNKSKEDARPKMQTKSKEESTTATTTAAITTAAAITTTSPPKEEGLIKQGVSFGVTDTVHHFQPHIEEDDGTLGTCNSVDDRSMNSEYTKTLESEVEDVIKDIFLIGTESKSRPGRRKLKYSHEIKRKLRQQKNKIYEVDEASAGTDDKTNDTENDDLAAVSKYRVNITKNQKAKTTSSSPDRSKNTKKNLPSSPDRSSPQKTAKSLSEKSPPNSPDRSPPSDQVLRSPRSLERGPLPNSPKSEKNTKLEKQTTSKAHREEKKEDDDPFSAMWGYMEGGMKAMSEALGLEADPTETTEKKSSPSRSKKSALSPSSQKKAAAKSSDTLSKSTDKTMCTDQIALILSGDEACTDSPTKTTRKAAATEEANQGLGGFMDYAQDVFFGPLGSVGTGDSGSFDVGGSKSQSQSVSIDDDDTAEDDVEVDVDDAEHDPKRLSASHLDETDPRLAHLALNAARSKHQIRGVEFDESIQIDMLSEVKVSVLELKLPLGLVFLENDGGCFVTQVSPDGSAARSGGVEVGDQLAAINGISSINMKVDDICTAISNAPDTKCVELMFVRYHGPFRPAATSFGGDSFGFSADGSPRKDSGPRSSGHETIVRIKPPQKKVKKGMGRWFGRGKKK